MVENKELKTLKDIEGFFQISDGETEGKYKIVISNDLKQEAIKHLKQMREVKKTIELGNHLRWEIFGKETWIKHFFNITEEDLK